MRIFFWCIVLGVLTILLLACNSSSHVNKAMDSNLPILPDFLIGGQIPFWLIHGESGTPSDTPEADAARPALQQYANEMFDVVIPSSIHWNWIEEQRGSFDFHRFDWANEWATQNAKSTLIQHIFWAWSETKPSWVQKLSDDAFRAAVFQHVQDVRNHVGDVPYIVPINEMTCKTYLEDRLGPEIIKEIFDATRDAFPDTELFLNEHGCPDTSDPSSPNLIQNTLDNYAKLVLKLESEGVDFDRVGFQSYFSESDVVAQGGIDIFVERYSNAVDSFTKKTGHKIIITELGFIAPDEDFKAEFLRAFFEMTIKNSNITGLIVFHWLDEQSQGTALVNLDGSLTKAGEVFYDVFDR